MLLNGLNKNFLEKWFEEFVSALNFKNINKINIFIFKFLIFKYKKDINKNMKVNVLGDCLRCILNAERAGKKQVLIRPASKIIIKFLKVM